MESKMLWAAGIFAAGIVAGGAGAIALCRRLDKSECRDALMSDEHHHHHRHQRRGRRMHRGAKDVVAEVVGMECGFCGKDISD